MALKRYTVTIRGVEIFNTEGAGDWRPESDKYELGLPEALPQIAGAWQFKQVFQFGERPHQFVIRPRKDATVEIKEDL